MVENKMYTTYLLVAVPVASLCPVYECCSVKGAYPKNVPVILWPSVLLNDMLLFLFVFNLSILCVWILFQSVLGVFCCCFSDTTLSD